MDIGERIIDSTASSLDTISVYTSDVSIGTLVTSNISPNSFTSLNQDDVTLYPPLTPSQVVNGIDGVGGFRAYPVLRVKLTNFVGGGACVGVVFDHCWSDLFGVVGLLEVIMETYRDQDEGGRRRVVKDGRSRQSGLGEGGEGGVNKPSDPQKLKGKPPPPPQVGSITYKYSDSALTELKVMYNAPTRHQGLFSHLIYTLNKCGVDVRTASFSRNERTRIPGFLRDREKEGGDVYVGNGTLITCADITNLSTTTEVAQVVNKAIKGGRGKGKMEIPTDVHFTAWTHAFEHSNLAVRRGGDQPEVRVGRVGERTALFLARVTGKFNVTVLGGGGGLKVHVRGPKEVLEEVEITCRREGIWRQEPFVLIWLKGFGGGGIPQGLVLGEIWRVYEVEGIKEYETGGERGKGWFQIGEYPVGEEEGCEPDGLKDAEVYVKKVRERRGGWRSVGRMEGFGMLLLSLFLTLRFTSSSRSSWRTFRALRGSLVPGSSLVVSVRVAPWPCTLV